MATLNFYHPISLSMAYNIFNGDMTIRNATQIQISSENESLNFYGTFFYGLLGVPGGTLTSAYYYQEGTAVFDITGLNHNVGTIANYIMSGDIVSVFSYLFNGNDVIYGSYGSEELLGYSGDDILYGHGGNDNLYGGPGNDLLSGGSGNNILNGGDGIDTVALGGIVSQYRISQNADNYVITGPQGTDTLIGCEYIRFGSSIYTTDVSLADATTSNPLYLAERITDLYVAYFNRGPDPAGFDYWFHEIYTGAKSLSTIAEDFAWSIEYLAMYPSSLTNREFVEQIYLNLFDRSPEQSGWDYWTGRLDEGSVYRSGFILNVIDGAYAPTAGPEDRTLIDNKHDASLYYTGRLALQQQEEFDYAIVDLLNMVSGDVATVAAAARVIDYAFDDPITLTGIMSDEAMFDSLWMIA
jgi:hypothetical protein